MKNKNSGYTGYSMSNRAVAAYLDGERPKSKWTKGLMLQALENYCKKVGYRFDESVVKGMSKSELFDTFFCEVSKHHTSKYCNLTPFYGVNEDVIGSYFTLENPVNATYSYPVIEGFTYNPINCSYSQRRGSHTIKLGSYSWSIINSCGQTVILGFEKIKDDSAKQAVAAYNHYLA